LPASTDYTETEPWISNVALTLPACTDFTETENSVFIAILIVLIRIVLIAIKNRHINCFFAISVYAVENCANCSKNMQINCNFSNCDSCCLELLC